jgi:hypothetical protein
MSICEPGAKAITCGVTPKIPQPASCHASSFSFVESPLQWSFFKPSASARAAASSRGAVPLSQIARSISAHP